MKKEEQREKAEEKCKKFKQNILVQYWRKLSQNYIKELIDNDTETFQLRRGLYGVFAIYLVDSMETLLTKEYRDEFYENGIDSNNQFE
jgi:hypothetical protein